MPLVQVPVPEPVKPAFTALCVDVEPLAVIGNDGEEQVLLVAGSVHEPLWAVQLPLPRSVQVPNAITHEDMEPPPPELPQSALPEPLCPDVVVVTGPTITPMPGSPAKLPEQVAPVEVSVQLSVAVGHPPPSELPACKQWPVMPVHVIVPLEFTHWAWPIPLRVTKSGGPPGASVFGIHGLYPAGCEAKVAEQVFPLELSVHESSAELQTADVVQVPWAEDQPVHGPFVVQFA